MERSGIAIIIPALNEQATIAAVVSAVSQYGQVIVVDDGSTDATAALAREAGAQVVSHRVNQGYEGALNSGFAHARAIGCRYVISIDADGQHNPAQLNQFIALLDQNYDLVLGVRDRLQRMGETVFATVGKKLWGMSDPMCGMKAYRIALYEKQGTFDTIHSVGSELAVRSIVGGCRFAELPIMTRDRLDAPRFGRLLSANIRILRAMFILVFLSLTKKLAR